MLSNIFNASQVENGCFTFSGRGRDILTSPRNLARDVSRVFSASYTTPKKIKKATKKAEKVVKVVFLKDVKFPETINKGIILAEGAFSMCTDDSEQHIREKLCSILKEALSIDVGMAQIQFACCSYKRLTVPAVSQSTFSFDANSVKSIMGQGKLYVNIQGIKMQV